MFFQADTVDRPAFDFSLAAPAAERMTASEQMFFHGSPLAHVVSYEEELRSDRFRRVSNLAHGRRIITDPWLHDDKALA